MFGNIPGNKSNIFEWEDLLKISEINADNSTKKFLAKINMLCYTLAPMHLQLKNNWIN